MPGVIVDQPSVIYQWTWPGLILLQEIKAYDAKVFTQGILHSL